MEWYICHRLVRQGACSKSTVTIFHYVQLLLESPEKVD
jgi:hypothetical protein